MIQLIRISSPMEYRGLWMAVGMQLWMCGAAQLVCDGGISKSKLFITLKCLATHTCRFCGIQRCTSILMAWYFQISLFVFPIGGLLSPNVLHLYRATIVTSKSFRFPCSATWLAWLHGAALPGTAQRCGKYCHSNGMFWSSLENALTTNPHCLCLLLLCWWPV